VEICRVIKNLEGDQKLYLHCKGGHGRSGILVACILIHYYGISPYEALHHTNRCHLDRPQLKEKWRKLGSPHRKRQKDFVHRFYKYLKYGRYSRNSLYILDNMAPCPVELPSGVYPNAHLAFQSFRDPENKEYIDKLQKGEFCPELIKNNHPDWEDKKIQYMALVLNNKFTQNKNARDVLLYTGLQPLIKSSFDTFWGDGKNGYGKNVHGRLLMKLRLQYLHDDFLEN
jgi:predicted NAD-dependent protein-ADP-ribosyltransferase YbiA (DUF1768 family)